MELPVLSTENIFGVFLVLLFIMFGMLFVAALFWVLYWVVVLWLRHRTRESDSLNAVLLQVTVPRENEIKIDAAQQMFASLAAIRGSGKFENFKPQPHLSFEIVGLPGDIRFYVHVPAKYRDFVEKQINGAYPEADIFQVNDPAAKQRENGVIGTEYNIFSEDGKVAFLYTNLKTSDYLPLKVYKDLPVDPLSSLTSVLAKMQDGEGAAIQILLRPADDKWVKAGRSSLSRSVTP